MIYNIELWAEASGKYNKGLYPLMIVYTIFLTKIQSRYTSLKTQLINELLQKNQNEKDT